MATRTYKRPEAYDPAEAHFTVEADTSADPTEYFFRLGAPTADDLALLRALIIGSRLGFFIGTQEVREARLDVMRPFRSVAGIGVDKVPGLTYDQDYTIKTSSAGAGVGKDGDAAEVEIEDITDGVRIRSRSGDQAEFGEWHELHAPIFYSSRF